MNDVILCRLAPMTLENAPAEIMWMPAGIHKINATQGGKAVTLEVLADASGAKAVQAVLAAHLAAGGPRPYFDFDHNDTAASAWPQAFTWYEGNERAAGIYAKVEWSKPGEDAITGKAYRSFSPAFLAAGTPKRLTGAPLNMGGLVNSPAFKSIAPIWAKESDNQQNKVMPDNINNNDSEAVIKAKDAEIANLQQQTAAFKAKETVRVKAEAKRFVDEAIARGALPAKDEVIQAKWRNLIESDEANADLLKAMPGNPALQGAITKPSGSMQIEAKDGLLEAVRAYQAKSSQVGSPHTGNMADVRADIFARDIKPFLAKNPDINLAAFLAANSLGSVAGNLILQQSLTLLKLRFPLLKHITTDFSDTQVLYGQQLITRLRAIPSVTDYDATNKTYVTSNASTTDVPITINAHKAVMIHFGQNELAGTKRDLFGEQVEGSVYALGLNLVTALYALILAANYSNNSVASGSGGTVDRKTLQTIAGLLNTAGVPPMGRFALLNSANFQTLATDASVVQLATYQRPEVITDNQLPPIAGFQPIEAPNLPNPGAEHLIGFTGTPDALAVATRIPFDYTTVFADVPSTAAVEVVKDADTGISLLVARFVDNKAGGAYWRAAFMYGVAVGQAASAYRIISS